MNTIVDAVARLDLIANAIQKSGAPTVILRPARHLLMEIYNGHINKLCHCNENQDPRCAAALALAISILEQSQPDYHR